MTLETWAYEPLKASAKNWLKQTRPHHNSGENWQLFSPRNCLSATSRRNNIVAYHGGIRLPRGMLSPPLTLRSLLVTKLLIRSVMGLCGLAAILSLAWTGDAVARPVPQDVANKAIEADIAFLQKALAKTPEKRAVGTIKATAMLLALNAQTLKQTDLRDQALKVAAAMADKNYAAAKEAASALKPGKAGTVKELKLHEMHKFDLGEVMSIFRNGTVGGLNIEKDIRAQAKSVTDLNLLETLGTRTALAGEYSLLMPPNEAIGDRKKKWDDWCKEMTQLGNDIATEAGKGTKADKAALGKKLKALDANCTNCHNVFRN